MEIKTPPGHEEGIIYVQFYVSADTTITRADYPLGQTSAWLGDSSGIVTLRGTFPTNIPTGTYYLGWIVTDDNRVDDTDEHDNAAYLESPRLTVVGGSYPRSSTVVYVDADARGAADGTCWRTAFNHLQEALTAAKPGSEIRVAEGTYTPDRGAGVTRGDREASFALKDGVIIRGGYAGASEPNPDARDVGRYLTILSGDLLGNDLEVPLPGDLERAISRVDNSRHVITAVDLETGATLDGLWVTGGYANGRCDPNAASADCQGAGLYVSTGDLTLRGCTFQGNWAAVGGGAVHATRSSIRLSDCAFYVNAAGAQGGAIDIDGSAVVASRCVLCTNAAGSPGGGAIWNSTGELTLVSCTLNGNTAGHGGGAIGNVQAAILSAANCCLHANYASVLAGAIENLSGGTVSLVNCTIAGNRQGQYAGALACGPAQGHGADELRITNCILWNVNREIWDRGGSSITVQHTDIAGGWPGPGNLNINPLFIDADGVDNIAGTADDDLRLHWASFCIDAGNGALLPEDVTDLDGDGDLKEPLPLDRNGGKRTTGSAVDMGAYEAQSP